MADMPDKSWRDRLSKLKGVLAIPGWVALVWKWLLEIIGWVGNLDVVHEHWSWITKLGAALNNPGVRYVPFAAGIGWLVAVVLYGDRFA